MGKRLIILGALACILCMQGAHAGSPIVEVQKWNNSKPGGFFTLFVHCTLGSPFNYNPKNPFLTEITMVKNAGGFVTVQCKVTNSAPWRKTFRIRWAWKSTDGMMCAAPSEAALAMVSLAGGEQQVIQGTSTAPNPTSVALTLFPHAK